MDDDQASVNIRSERCSLPRAELDDRLREIEGLVGRALRERRDEVGTSVLSFDPAAAAEIRDLVRRERDCCGHLEFSVEETDEAIRVTIRSRSHE
jgi:hypothetical protein